MMLRKLLHVLLLQLLLHGLMLPLVLPHGYDRYIIIVVIVA